jgi:hypothetical protein
LLFNDPSPDLLVSATMGQSISQPDHHRVLRQQVANGRYCDADNYEAECNESIVHDSEIPWLIILIGPICDYSHFDTESSEIAS